MNPRAIRSRSLPVHKNHWHKYGCCRVIRASTLPEKTGCHDRNISARIEIVHFYTALNSIFFWDLRKGTRIMESFRCTKNNSVVTWIKNSEDFDPPLIPRLNPECPHGKMTRILKSAEEEGDSGSS